MNVRPQAPGFEGSYLGAGAKISPRAVMECKICWTVYDPADGDDTRQIAPGTPFAALPDDWTCPGCSAPAAQFLVHDDPGADEARMLAELDRRTAALVADFTEVFNGKMRDVPLVNHGLHVQAVAFRPWEGGFLGVLVAPWFMNLILLPGPDRTVRAAGVKEIVAFPSGDYEFIHNAREMTGPYLACSLFSPMGDFGSQMQAVEVAGAIMAELFRADHRPATEPVPEPGLPPVLDAAPSRRALLTGGIG